MKVYRANLGHSHTWLVRAKDFREAAKRALNTTEKKAKDFEANVELTSLELIGEEE
jgi:hypothetical protein